MQICSLDLNLKLFSTIFVCPLLTHAVAVNDVVLHGDACTSSSEESTNG